MEKIHKLKSAVHALPDKKRYAEFITAVLSVPVLITVLIMNMNNLKKTNSVVPETTPTPTVAVTTPKAKEPTEFPTPSIAPVTSCTKEVGPIEIASPKENEIIETNPISIDIERQGNSFCEVVWSYRINNDPWSEYIDKSIFLYNLSPGEKTIEVKVRSIASTDQKILKRIFIVPGKDDPIPTPTTASSSASIQ